MMTIRKVDALVEDGRLVTSLASHALSFSADLNRARFLNGEAVVVVSQADFESLLVSATEDRCLRFNNRTYSVEISV